MLTTYLQNPLLVTAVLTTDLQKSLLVTAMPHHVYQINTDMMTHHTAVDHKIFVSNDISDCQNYKANANITDGTNPW